MNETPRVRSGAYPQTPATVHVGRGAPPTPSPSSSRSNSRSNSFGNNSNISNNIFEKKKSKQIFARGSSSSSSSLLRTSNGSFPGHRRRRSSSARRRSSSSSSSRHRLKFEDDSLFPDEDDADDDNDNDSDVDDDGGPRPLIPLTILDAPTQRFYALTLYVALLAWKLYDWLQLVEDNADSFWLFLKWTGVDFIFLFGLPELRIPWLELSQPVCVVLFLAHVVADYMLMFNVGLPWHAWALGLVKVVYDRELSISEHYVKTSHILHNASLISGRQIINILPEGSAVLNPDGLPFCLGNASSSSSASSSPTTVLLPLYFNATVPAEVELIRRDLDTNAEETLRLSRSQLRDIARLVRRQQQTADSAAPAPAVRFDVPVKKTGAYRLGRVLDEYKLDVQRPSPFSFVVACPSARVGRSGRGSARTSKKGKKGKTEHKQSWAASLTSSPPPPDPVARCHGDLSDLLLDVHGTPPLKIIYSRTINGKDHSFHFQSLQPEGFASPLLGTGGSSSPGRPSSASALAHTHAPFPEADEQTALVPPHISMDGGDDVDISWARSRHVSVGLNETMHVGGEWQYSIDQVHDAFGNVAVYSRPADEHELPPRQYQPHAPPHAPTDPHLVQSFVVHERPRVRLQGCDLRQPLKVSRGRPIQLPVRYELPGVHRAVTDDQQYALTYLFSPLDSLTASGDHGDVVSTESFAGRRAQSVPLISEPGLYTLRSVASSVCAGEVQEPASCLLLNPLEPRLTLRAEPIPDSCGSRSVGLRVDLDLVGTAPFVVQYDVSSNGVVRHEKVVVKGLRHQLELVPRVAGHHKYTFRSVYDSVYSAQALIGPEMTLEQNVKPAAEAMIDHEQGRTSVCLGATVGVDAVLLGEAPFSLEYVLLHEGKRHTFRQDDIDGMRVRLETPPLTEGGEYTLALTSIQDRSGCRTHLQGVDAELVITVRRQRPRAAFGLLENRRRVLVVESAPVRLPLRLTGEGPWRVTYQNLGLAGGSGKGELLTRTLRSDNDYLLVSERGTYEIAEVWDNMCQGVVDASAAVFEVGWLPRPELAIVTTDAIERQADGLLVKQDVCEGDIDGFEIDLKGSPPYHVDYSVRHQPTRGQTSLIHKDLDAALGRAALQMDTSRAGTYRYEFAAPADSLYSGDPGQSVSGWLGSSSSSYGDGSDAQAVAVLQQTVHAKPTAAFARAGQSFKYCMAEQDNDERIPMVLTGVPPFYVEIEIRHQSGAGAETYGVPSIPTRTYGLRIPRQHLRPGTQQVRIRKVRDARGCQQKTDEMEGWGSGSSGSNNDQSSSTGKRAKALAGTVQVQLFESPAVYALESRTDYCVGERISYTLSGTPPFDVAYTFNGMARHGSAATTTFRRVAEAPGDFSITGVGDGASACRAAVNITRTIHPLPWVRVSQGRTARSDIHEGGTVEMVFEFGGTPPFEFSYTRSTNARKGQRSQVLETRHDVAYEHRKTVRASQEGTYEVVAVKDKYCAFSTQRAKGEGV